MFTQGQLQELSINGLYLTPVEKTIEFAGGTTNAIGDFDGTGDPFTIFEVTGRVAIKVFAVCTEDLAGASATIAVGTALTPAGLIASTTATDIDANEIWHDATPDASTELSSVLTEKIISQDVIGSIATANITDGTIVFYAFWRPLSDGATVTAA